MRKQEARRARLNGLLPCSWSTGVDAVWLMKGDLKDPKTPTGFGYNYDQFLAAQSMRAIARDPRMKLGAKVDAEMALKKFSARQTRIFYDASRMNRLGWAHWKMELFLDEMEKTFLLKRKKAL